METMQFSRQVSRLMQDANDRLSDMGHDIRWKRDIGSIPFNHTFRVAYTGRCNTCGMEVRTNSHPVKARGSFEIGEYNVTPQVSGRAIDNECRKMTPREMRRAEWMRRSRR
jgi:hypothetical protein